MSAKRSIWRSDQWERGKRHVRLGPDKIAHFGYRVVPEDEKVKWVMRHFNTIARKYDLMNTLLSFGIHHVWKRVAVRMLKLNAGDRVIDVCGGTGDLAILAANAVGSSGGVVLYDINRAMMEVGRPKVAKAPNARHITYVQGNAEQISFTDQRFDAAMVGFGIRNLTHIEEGFKEIHRVLKPGGKLMCLEFSRPTPPLFRWLYDLYSFHIMPYLGELIVGSKQAYTYLPESIRLFPLPNELSTLLVNAGFSQVTYRKLTNGIAVIHLARKDLMQDCSAGV
jgi:demethylmenaquinone methyltransferase/2-methoxy-6-polyprenyl-1,4-benzoquinol methylase